VGVSDSTTVSDDPNFLRYLCHVRQALFWGQRPENSFWAIFAILVDFAIFSGFLN
jgi:hypothetical protein